MCEHVAPVAPPPPWVGPAPGSGSGVGLLRPSAQELRHSGQLVVEEAVYAGCGHLCGLALDVLRRKGRRQAAVGDKGAREGVEERGDQLTTNRGREQGGTA